MTALKVAAFALIIIGAVINYGSKLIANRIGLAEKMNVEEAGEFSGEELEKYKHTKASVRVKLVGFSVLLAGVVMLFIAYRFI